MRILFITKDFIIEPLGILYLSGALKKAGHQTDIVKADVENVEEKMREFTPDIVAYSFCTGQHKYFRDLNLQLKNKFHFISVFGGAHPTFFNEFIKENGVDIICIGEGEEAIVDLANKLEGKEDFTNILNLWVKEGDRVFENPVRSLSDIGALAFPDRELIYKYSKSRNHPVKNFMWSRGCPYNCPYCFNHSLKKIYKNNSQYVRFRSVDNLLEEILEVKNSYPLKMVYFQDDTFGVRQDLLEEFCQKYQKLVNLPFHCHLRVGLVNKKMVDLIKRAGCFGVSFGIEAGNDFLRNEILGRNMTKKEIIEAAMIIKRAGLKLRTFNMLGLPNGSLEMDFETLALSVACKPDLGWACIYQPYPRTQLGDLCVKMGIYDGDIDKISETFFEESVLNIPDKDKINNLQKLFSLAVSYPVLSPLIKILVNASPNIVFRKIYSFWKQRQSKKVYNT
jgi:anaerobic magnesium-protoporphyrin IX monomethyl ester cyclase